MHQPCIQTDCSTQKHKEAPPGSRKVSEHHKEVLHLHSHPCVACGQSQCCCPPGPCLPQSKLTHNALIYDAATSPLQQGSQFFAEKVGAAWPCINDAKVISAHGTSTASVCSWCCCPRRHLRRGEAEVSTWPCCPCFLLHTRPSASSRDNVNSKDTANNIPSVGTEHHMLERGEEAGSLPSPRHTRAGIPSHSKTPLRHRHYRGSSTCMLKVPDQQLHKCYEITKVWQQKEYIR